MLFQELGALLKEKREERGVSPEEIAEKLKIPLKGIYAIEEGDKDALPHEIYIRTFIKGYASYVGYSEEEIDDIFVKIDDFNDASATKKNNNNPLADFESKSRAKGGKYFTILLIIAALGGGGYWYLTKDSALQDSVSSVQSFWGTEESINQNTPTPQSEPQIQESNESVTEDTENPFNEASDGISEENTSNNTSEGVTNNINAENNQNIVTAADNASGDALDNTEKSETLAEKQEVQENIAEDTPLITQALATSMNSGSDSHGVNLDTPLARRINWEQVQKVEQGQQQAVIHVSQDCWMSVRLDGKTTHFTLKKNSQRDFIFKQSAQFQLGNASAVTLFHNGKPVETGDSSELRVVKLSR